MKKAIFYTIHKDWRNYKILTVTSEKRTGRFVASYGSSRLYGRTECGNPTNATSSDCYGRFADIEDAREAMRRIELTKSLHLPKIRAAEGKLALARRAEKDEIDDILNQCQSMTE